MTYYLIGEISVTITLLIKSRSYLSSQYLLLHISRLESYVLGLLDYVFLFLILNLQYINC